MVRRPRRAAVGTDGCAGYARVPPFPGSSEPHEGVSMLVAIVGVVILVAVVALTVVMGPKRRR